MITHHKADFPNTKNCLQAKLWLRLLVIALALGLSGSMVQARAGSPALASSGLIGAAWSPPPPLPQHMVDLHSTTPRSADWQQQHQPQPEDVQPRPAPVVDPPFVAHGGTTADRPLVNALHPDTHPAINLAFAHTYAVGTTGDDAGTTNCATDIPANCSLRSAINTANTDGHGSTSDLILLTPANSYTVNASLPTLGPYITLSNSNTQSCPGGLTNVADLQGGSSPTNSD